METHHHHPGNPEEQDIKTGHQAGGRIIDSQFFGPFGPSHGGKRPEGRGKPGVEHIGFLADFITSASGADGRILLRHGYLAAVITVPGRNAVAPPDLAGDAPVADVLHPLEIGVFPLERNDPGTAFPHRGNGLFRQRSDLHVPLERHVRFDNRLAAIASSYCKGMVGDLLQQTRLFQVGKDLFPGSESVKAFVLMTGGIDDPRLVEDVYPVEIMALAYFEIVEVMGRCDLDHAGAELHVHIFVRDYGNVALQQGKDDMPTDQVTIPFISRIHGNGRVAEHGLRPGGGDHEIPVRTHHRIPQVPEAPFLFFVFHLDIREGGMATGAPVDQPVVPVDKPLFIKAYEDLANRRGKTLVHGEALALPVAGSAKPLQLIDYLATRFRLPCPDSFDKGLTADLMSARIFRCKLPFNHVLRRDAGMVGTRHPQDGVAGHPLPAAEDVLKGIVEGMPHVEYAGDIGGRNYNAVGFFIRRRHGVKKTSLLPLAIPFILNSLRFIHLCQFSVRHISQPLSRFLFPVPK